MKIIRKVTVAFLVIALMVILLPVNVFAADAQFIIYHTNDIHGRAEGTPEKDNRTLHHILLGDR